MGEDIAPTAQLEHTEVLNSPLELGVRALALLVEIHPVALDVQRLVLFDYACVHSADLEGGPASLHTATPFRGGETLVRRSLLEDGLLLMVSRGLVDARTDAEGISYSASEDAAPFLDSLNQPYNQMLKQRAHWVASTLGSQSTTEISKLFESKIGQWGGEFLFTGEPGEELE
jgi:hypothetical protein